MYIVKVNNDWECVSGEDYQWNLLIERLEQLCHLNTTLKYSSEEPIGTLHCIKYEYSSITLNDLIKFGRGNFNNLTNQIMYYIIHNSFIYLKFILILGEVSTIISKWLASMGIDPTLIINEYLMDINNTITTNQLHKNQSIMSIQEGVTINTEIAIEARVLSVPEKEILDVLKCLKFWFPYSLDCNTLLSNICWEYLSVWQTGVSDLRPLNAALNVANKIPCPHIRLSK